MGMEDNPSGSGSKDDIEEPLLNNGDSANGKGPEHESENNSPLQDSTFGYNHGPRPCRDVAFAIIFLLVTLATFGLGIFSIVHHNSDFRWMESAHYERNQSRCSVSTSQQLVHGVPSVTNKGMSSLKLGFSTGDIQGPSSRTEEQVWRRYPKLWLPTRLTTTNGFGVALITSLVVTLVLSVPIVLGLVWLLRTYTKELVYISLPLFVLFPVALNIVWFVACAKDAACQKSLSLSVRILFFVFIFLFCAIVVWIIFANFARIELTIQILRTASQALYKNLSLLIVVPGLSLLLLLFYVPTGFFIAFCYMNGKYVPNSDLEERPDLPCGRGTDRDCCVWKTEAWVPAYLVLAAFSLLWTTFVIAQAKVYTISGTIAQWYFAQVNTPTVGAMKRSLGHAFSSSFGTVCFSGLIFAFVRLIRSAVDSAKSNQDRGGSIVVALLQCCYDWILQAIEFMTKFTIDFAAITGESFCASAAMTYDLLKRNLLSTVFVEVISTRLLGGVMFVVSIIYALAVWGILLATTKLGSTVYIVALLSWALLLLVLFIFIAVMNIIVDTVYICYAIDKDRGVVSKSEAHDVYVLLPVSQDDRASLAVRQGRGDSSV